MLRSTVLLLLALWVMPYRTAAQTPDLNTGFRLDSHPALRGFQAGTIGPIGPGRLRPPAAIAVLNKAYHHGPTEIQFHVLLFPSVAAAKGWATSYQRGCSAPVNFLPSNSAGIVTPNATAYYVTEEDYRKAKQRLGAKGNDLNAVWKVAHQSIQTLMANTIVNRMVLMVMGVQHQGRESRNPIPTRRLNDAQMTRAVREVVRELVLRARRYPLNQVP